jgi:D-glycero-D-manno-heptose 1,7-bisphosphate phosphatase
MPGVRELLSQVPWKRSNAPYLALASNQDQVAYGHLSLRVARELLRDLAYAATGVILEDAALQLCPHALHIDCDCRKPKPGMLLRLIEHFQVSKDDTVFVGNSEVDRAAAAAAGVAFRPADSLFGAGSGAIQQ